MTIDPQALSFNTRQLLIKRLSTVEALGYTGPLGELIIDSTLKLLRIQDGSSPGGILIPSAASPLNLDGGHADSVYTGITALDAGTA
jgi:hypothetical protein